MNIWFNIISNGNIHGKYPKKCSIFETCMFTGDCLLIEKNFVNTPTVN